MLTSINSIGSRGLVFTPAQQAVRSNGSTARRRASLARVGVRDFMTKLVAAGEAIQQLQASHGDIRAGSARRQTAQVTGTVDLGLGTTTTTASTSSSEAISTVTTDAYDRNPRASLAQTTAQLTIHGNPTDHTDALYELQADGVNTFTVGQRSDYTFTLTKDGVGHARVLVSAGYVAEDRISIGGGLEISFGAGDVASRENFTFKVATGIDMQADTTVPLDGSAGETYLDSAVTTGTFDVNGETIRVLDTGTVDDVIGSINGSAAGVTAAYDSVNDQLTLTASDSSVTSITLDNDSSGFLAAMKLSTGTVTGSTVEEIDQAIADVGALSAVSSGSFKINGTSFTVDVSVDSLQDVIDQVEASSAEAELSYSSDSGRLRLTAENRGETLTVEDDTTGLFSAVGIAEGATRASPSRGIRRNLRESLMEKVAEVVELVNELSGTVTNEGIMDGAAMSARDSIRSAIQTHFTDSTSTAPIDSGFGLKFNVSSDTAKPFMQLGSAGESALNRVLRQGPGEALETLFGTRKEPGLLDAVLQGMDKAQQGLISKYGSVGILLNIEA